MGMALHIRKESKKIKKVQIFILLSLDKYLKNLIRGKPAPLILVILYPLLSSICAVSLLPIYSHIYKFTSNTVKI
jgi:membrane-associated HD superfamily phosphohydrolase